MPDLEDVHDDAGQLHTGAVAPRQIPPHVLAMMDADREERAREAWLERDSNTPRPDGRPRLRPDAVPHGLPAEIFERMLFDRHVRRADNMARAYDVDAPKPEPRTPGQPPPSDTTLKLAAMAMLGFHGREATRKLGLRGLRSARSGPARRRGHARRPRRRRIVRRNARPRAPGDDGQPAGDPPCGDCGRRDLEVAWSLAEALDLCLGCYARRMP
jgi:hypothetical protein